MTTTVKTQGRRAREGAADTAETVLPSVETHDEGRKAKSNLMGSLATYTLPEVPTLATPSYTDLNNILQHQGGKRLWTIIGFGDQQVRGRTPPWDL